MCPVQSPLFPLRKQLLRIFVPEAQPTQSIVLMRLLVMLSILYVRSSAKVSIFCMESSAEGWFDLSM